MKKLFSNMSKRLKTVFSLVLVAALVVGTINIGGTNAKAETGEAGTSEIVGYATLKDDGTIDRIVGTNDQSAFVTSDGITVGKTIAKSQNSDYGYDITLSVETSQTITRNESAVVLVLDMSSSLNDNALSSLKNAAKSFVAQLPGDTYVSVVKYGDCAIRAIDWKKASDYGNSDITSITSNNLGYGKGIGTNTEAGMRLAYNNLFQSSSVVKDFANKSVVLFTDGVPTYYCKTQGSSWNSLYKVEAGSLGGFGSEASENTVNAVKNVVKDLTEGGAQIYSIYLGDTNAKCYDYMAPQTVKCYNKYTGNGQPSGYAFKVENACVDEAPSTIIADSADVAKRYVPTYSKRMLSKKCWNCNWGSHSTIYYQESTTQKNTTVTYTAGNFLADISTSTYRVGAASDLQSVFEAMAHVVTEGFDCVGWVVTDPIPAMFVYNDANGESANCITWQLSTPTSTTTNGSTTTYVYTKTYHVELDADNPSFNDGQNYPTNGRTILTYSGQDSTLRNRSIEFRVPVIKGWAPVYDYEINYFYENENGSETFDGKSYTLDSSKKDTGSEKVNTVINLASINGYNTKWTKADGYEYAGADRDSMTIAATGNVINVYYNKAAFDYTVKYYVDDASDPVATWNGTEVWDNTAGFGINWNNYAAEKFNKTNITAQDVAADNKVVLTKAADKNEWSFTMPMRDVEIRVDLTTNTYTVVYKDGDNTVKSYPSVKWGEKLTDIPAAPVHDGYASAAWEQELANVEIKQDYSVNAVQGEQIQYNVYFEVYVGGVKKDIEGVEGTTTTWHTPVAIPTVTAEAAGATDNNEYDYTDLEWSIYSGTATVENGNIVGVESDVTVRRIFTATSKSAYLFQYVNSGDDITGTTTAKVIETRYEVSEPDAGSFPSLADFTEANDDNNTFSYAFETVDGSIKWDKTVVDGVTYFTANRVRTYKVYNVTFIFDYVGDYNKDLQVTVPYRYNQAVTLPEGFPTAQTADDAQYTYTFSGWGTFDNATADRRYTASESRTVKTYHYSFTLIDSRNENQTLASETDVKYGTPIDVPSYTVPVVTGYTVKDVPSDNWPKEPSFTLTGDLDATVTIKYDANDCVVTFKFVAIDENGVSVETPIDTVSAKYDDEVTFPEIPEGLVKESDQAFTYRALEVSGRPDGKNDMSNFTCQGDDTITITQKQTRNSYTINFVLYDVDFAEAKTGSVTLPYGSVATAPITIPTVDQCKDRLDEDNVKMGLKYDYTVTGWCSDEACTIPADLKVTGNATVYAKVTKVDHKYDVNFLFTKYNTTEAVKLAGSGSYKYGDTITVPKCEGTSNTDQYTYTISFNREGWKELLGKENGFVVTDVTAGDYAATETRTENTYAINFVVKYSGDDDEPTQKTAGIVDGVVYGGTADGITIPRTNTEFYKDDTAKWDYPEEIVFEAYENVTKNDTVYFDYIPTLKTYDAVFYDEFGNIVISQSAIGYGEAVTVTPGTQTKDSDDRYDYEFKGWAVKGDETKALVDFTDDIPECMTEEGLEYVAVFEAREHVYTVTFVDYNGTVIGTEEFAPAAVWNTTKAGFYLSDAALVDAAELGAEGADKRSNTVDTYTFTGWMFKADDLADTYVDAAEKISGRITESFKVYASYTSEKNTYQIRYHFEDKVEAPFFATDTVTAGGIITVRKIGPEKASNETQNFFFAGWVFGPAPEDIIVPSDEPEVRALRSVAVLAETPTVEPAPVYVSFINMTDYARNIDLYPIYTDGVRYYTVKFVVDGTVVKIQDDIEYMGSATAPAETPSRASVSDATSVTTYTFKGWDKDFSVVTEDMDVYAQFDSVTTPIHIIPILTTTPTPVPTAEPTATPTPVPEIVPVEEPEVPEGEPTATPTPEVIEVIEEPETPEGTPDEEIEIELDDTPQGLPKTGVVAAGVLYGIGSACIIIGSVLASRTKRKKEEQ